MSKDHDAKHDKIHHLLLTSFDNQDTRFGDEVSCLTVIVESKYKEVSVQHRAGMEQADRKNGEKKSHVSTMGHDDKYMKQSKMLQAGVESLEREIQG